MVARHKVKNNSTDTFSVSVGTLPFFYLEPGDTLRIRDKNSGINDEYFKVESLDVSIEGEGVETNLTLRKV
jgi:hypothetical protein